MLCSGEISRHRLFTRLWPHPPGPLSNTGLNSTSASGLDETVVSAPSSSSPYMTPAAAATCPPADPPPAAIRCGSMPRRALFARSHRTAALPSATQANGEVLWRERTR